MSQALPPSNATTGPARPSPQPEIASFTLGPWQTNCYVVAPPREPGSSADRPCWIIDASFEPGPIIEFVRKERLIPQALILTHAHIDHIAGVAEIVAAFKGKSGPDGAGPLPVWNHPLEAAWLNDPELNLSAFSGMPVTAPGPDRALAQGDELDLGSTRWRILHVPGHSPGSIALACLTAPHVISGDALFAGSIGRTDFPGCSLEQLAASIRHKLYTLDPHTTVHPGHGPTTTVARERQSNPYVPA
jgi:hydroxyacylglutathione hydrolase